MNNIDDMIYIVDKNICKNISRFDETERGLLSQNILGQLRNLVEYTCMKIYFYHNGISKLETDEKIIGQNKSAIKFIYSVHKYNFLKKFHKLLQLSASHYTFGEEVSERLMLKYYEYLLRIKCILKDMFDMEILKNISEFPIKLDPLMTEYYTKIAHEINKETPKNYLQQYNERYYIQKVKPFFVLGSVYYEITFTTALSNISKFDRIIAFSKVDITENYAVKFKVKQHNIEVIDKKLPILIIDSFEVAIRPCEFANFARIFGNRTKYNATGKEYQQLMVHLRTTGNSIVDILLLDDGDYSQIREQILHSAKASPIFDILDDAREIIQENKSGANVIKYLLYRMNNKIIRWQLSNVTCNFLSNLYLKPGCGVFDKMPLNSSLNHHNPLLRDLIDCIGIDDRQHELFARRLKNNTEKEGCLYTKTDFFDNRIDIDNMIYLYNSNVYYKHKGRKVCKERDYLFIKEYESDTLEIVRNIITLSEGKIIGYKNSVEAWLASTNYNIDCENKKDFLLKMFSTSNVALIYGSAGTGKSTMINHISNFFHDKNKIYLANTNPAIENLKRKVSTANTEFMTITKYNNRAENNNVDVLFIDECSTVSNSDMMKILNKSSFDLLVLAGDTYQIESINYGNWFGLIKKFIKSTSVFELTKPYRTDDMNLISLWTKVRQLDDDILEHLTRNGYTMRLNNEIFEKKYNDEIILCLNYDGLYGINNLNKFLQSNNPNVSVPWGVASYKIGDPILFNESERFAPAIYNNLKGKIIDIEPHDTQIVFTIDIEKSLNSLDVKDLDLELIDTTEEGTSIIKFTVNKHLSTDEDDDSSSSTVVPFQIAYAVSIHKSQGLEYDSVKIIITDEIGERISHNIFYTAITRAKENLKIFWSPETEKLVLESFKVKNTHFDTSIIKQKIRDK